MVHGSQGGWHFITAFEAYRSEPLVEIAVAGVDVDTGERVCQHGDSPLQVTLEPLDDCRSVYYNLYCYILDPLPAPLVDGACDTPPETLPGRELRFDFSLLDSSGHGATATQHIIAAAAPGDRTDCRDEGEDDTGDSGS